MPPRDDAATKSLGVGEVRGRGVPSPEKSILYIKIAIFNAFWALFIVPLHVFQIRSSASGLKNCCCVHAESKRR